EPARRPRCLEAGPGPTHLHRGLADRWRPTPHGPVDGPERRASVGLRGDDPYRAAHDRRRHPAPPLPPGAALEPGVLPPGPRLLGQHQPRHLTPSWLKDRSRLRNPDHVGHHPGSRWPHGQLGVVDRDSCGRRVEPIVAPCCRSADFVHSCARATIEAELPLNVMDVKTTSETPGQESVSLDLLPRSRRCRGCLCLATRAAATKCALMFFLSHATLGCLSATLGTP